MATLIRGEIVDLVEANLNRTDKESQIQDLCDAALKQAVNRYGFPLVRTTVDVQTTTSQDYIETPSGLLTIISAAVKEGTTPDRVWPLTLQSRRWWDDFVIDPAVSIINKPTYGLHDEAASKIFLYSIPDSTNYYIKLRYDSYPSFTDDSTENPIPRLDLWMESWVTSKMFRRLEQFKSAAIWKNEATGQMNDAIAMQKRNPAKRRQREMRGEYDYHTNYPIAQEIRTTGLYDQSWR